MPFQDYLNAPQNAEGVPGQMAVADIGIALKGIGDSIATGIKIFAKENANSTEKNALKDYNNEMNKLWQAKQQGQITDRAFRAQVTQKHVEMSNMYGGQFTDKFAQEQQNLFGYNVVGSTNSGNEKTQEQQAMEVANKLKTASLEEYAKQNPSFNMANNPDFYTNGAFDIDKAYGFVVKDTELNQQIQSGNPNAVLQQFSLQASPLLAELRKQTGMFTQLQSTGNASTDSLRAQEQLGIVQQQLSNALEQRRIDIMAKLPVDTKPEVRKQIDDSMKDTIESAKAIVPYMNETFANTQKAMEANLGLDGLQAGHMLVTLKQVGIGDDIINNIVSMKIASDPKLQTQVYKSLNDAVNSITNQQNVEAIKTLTAIRDWTKDPKKSIMDFDTTTRNNMVTASLQNVKQLSAKTALHPDEQQGFMNSSAKLAGLVGLSDDPNSVKNLSTWLSTPAWRDQFNKLAPTVGQEKANQVADNVRALQLQAFKEYSVDLRNNQFTYTEKTGQMNPGFLTMGTSAETRVLTSKVETQPFYNATTGRVELDSRVVPTREQQQLINQINQTLTTFADLNKYDEASVTNKLTGLAAREIVARGLLNVEVKGESSLPKESQNVTSDAMTQYFESLQQRAASDNFLQGVNKFRERVNAFANNIYNDSYNGNSSTSNGGAGGQGDSSNVAGEISMLDMPGDLTVENIKGTIAEEGLRNKVYVDSTGNRTVGIGFNMESNGAKTFWKDAGLTTKFEDVYNGKATLSEEDAIKLFNVTKQHAITNASKLVNNWDKLGEHRQAALADMVFQMGVAGVKGFKNSLKLIEQGRFQEAAQNLMKSKWAQQTPARAARVAEMIASNQDRFTVNNRLVSQGTISKKSSIV